MGKYCLITLGCFRNEVESDNFRSALRVWGYSEVESIEEADFIIINSCGFISDACDEGIDTILKVDEIRNNAKKPAPIIIAGCMSQRYGTALMEEMPEIDGVVGVDWFKGLKSSVEEVRSGGKYAVEPGPPQLTTCRRDIDSSENATLLVRISDGCDRRCSFCTIPKIKGKHESRKPEDIVSEVRLLSNGKEREVVLVGQDLTSYGTDLPEDIDLADLIKMISDVPEVHWIRLLYLHPEGLTEALIEEMVENPKVCDYFDIPFQHSCEKVIKKMGRHGDEKGYIETIERIRARCPVAAIRTTLMTGFPGEGEQEFVKLCEFVEKADLDWMGSFCYCPEEGTKAASCPEKVPHSEAVKRYNILLDIQERVEYSKLDSLKGRKLEVVIDERSDIDGYDFIGRSYREAPVVDGVIYLECPGGKGVEVGDFTEALITGREGLDLAGRIEQ